MFARLVGSGERLQRRRGNTGHRTRIAIDQREFHFDAKTGPRRRDEVNAHTMRVGEAGEPRRGASVREVYGQIPAPVVADGPPGAAAIAAGSQGAVAAGAAVLEQGGNAVDAALAAAFAAAVSEPVLTSLGGGGFCLMRDPGASPQMLDFFVDTPGRGHLNPHPHVDTVVVQFGTSAQQAFTVGWGSVAVPGCFAGYLDAHRRWGSLPLATIMEPAIVMARQGVALDEVQRSFLHLTSAVLTLTPSSEHVFAPALAGERFTNPAYADLLDALATGALTGPHDPAYVDPIVSAMTQHGGLVTREDLLTYAPQLRLPISTGRATAQVWTNPPPSFGGAIVMEALGRVAPTTSETILWPGVVEALLKATESGRTSDLNAGATQVARGTTHVSVIDRAGRVAALTTSTGSGSGTMVRGVAFNNMLGEEDLNPHGMHALPPGQRMGSMMAPMLVELADGTVIAAGSGGSERIRSALTGFLVRVIDLHESPGTAIGAPRVHPMPDQVQCEPGFSREVVAHMREGHPVQEWPSGDLYFGGIHAVSRAPDGSVHAIGDARRAGAVAVVR